VGFEPTIAADERPQIYALDGTDADYLFLKLYIKQLPKNCIVVIHTNFMAVC
jgi:hypothetical protein